MDEIYARMPEWVIGVEDWNRWDFIAYYLDEKTWQRYSRRGYPIAEDEMCREWNPWTICKVECIQDGPGTFEYHWKILSRRPDTNEDDKRWMLQVP